MNSLLATLLLSALAGFGLRFDDNHKPAEWREVAEILESEGMRGSFVVVSSALSDEQGACLRDLAKRGHEIVDHTAQHGMYKLQFKTREEFAAHTNKSYVACVDERSRRVYVRPQIDWSHPSRVRFRGAITNGVLTIADPLAAKKLHFSRKFRVVRTGKLYGVASKGEPKRVRGFYGDAIDEDVPETEMESVDQAAITLSREARRDQAALTRRNFDRLGLPRPTMWIQPGGWEAFLDWQSLREVYGREFGYVGADAVVGSSPHNGCLNDCDPENGRWTFKPSFAYFDEDGDLDAVKRRVADSIALNRSFIYISHMNARRLPGKWDEWKAKTRQFAHWLKAAKVPTLTLTQLSHATYDKSVILPRIFPSFKIDRDGDGIPDGIRFMSGATADLSRGEITLAPKGEIQIGALAGLVRGDVIFRLTVRGEKGQNVTVTLMPRGTNGNALPHRTVTKTTTLEKSGTCEFLLPFTLTDQARTLGVTIRSASGLVLKSADIKKGLTK